MAAPWDRLNGSSTKVTTVIIEEGGAETPDAALILQYAMGILAELP